MSNCTYCGTQATLRASAMNDVLVVENGPHGGHHVAEFVDSHPVCCCGGILDVDYDGGLQDQIDELESALGERDRAIKELRDDLDLRNQRIAELETDLQKKKTATVHVSTDPQDNLRLRLQFLQVVVFIMCGGGELGIRAASEPAKVLREEEADLKKSLRLAKAVHRGVYTLVDIADAVGELADLARTLEMNPEDLPPPPYHATRIFGALR